MVNYNILYVDDESVNLRGFEITFEDRYNIFTATSPHEARKLLEKNDFHIIITDHKMPKTSGIDFLKEIKDIYPKPIKMILTGYGDLEEITKAKSESQIYTHINKPWEESEMIKVIEEALQVYHAK